MTGIIVILESISILTLRGVIIMTDCGCGCGSVKIYKCEKCGKVAAKEATCCGKPMKKLT